jgi:hypothetical protein
MWSFIVNILTNAGLLFPLIVFVLVFISGRDERIEKLTKMKIQVNNFEELYSPVYRGIQRKVETLSEYEIEKINKVRDDIKLTEKKGRDNLKMFVIFLSIYLLCIMDL